MSDQPDRPDRPENDTTRKQDRKQDRKRTPARPMEEDPAVERAFTDDTTATPLTTEDEDDRGPLAPSFREPGESVDRDERDGEDDRDDRGSSR